MADNPTQPAAPLNINEDALKGFIREGVQSALTDVAQRAQQQQAAQQAQHVQQQVRQQQNQDPIYNGIVRPHIEPAMRAANQMSQGALDAVRFYQKHPGVAQHMDEIERRFDALAQSGTPFDRQTIYNHYVGENFDRFAEQRQQEIAQRAAQGATVGAAGVGRLDAPAALSRESLQGLSLEELEKLLEGVRG